jgi:HAE1 family hydrophobic/amphiphilic exporter-1
LRIVDFSVRKPVTVVMATVALVIFGLIAFSNLAVNLLPDITFPTLTVRTEYPGSAPAEVENLISKPIEEAVGVVSGVIRVSSVSRAGLSDVIVEFNWGTNMDFAAIDVREKFDGVVLPKDAERPILLRFDPQLAPIMRISLSGIDDLASLRLLAEQQIKRRLESIEGVASIIASGGLEEEVHVELEEVKLARLKLPVTQIVERLSKENINLTGGTLKDGEVEFLVRTLNQFVSIDEINEIVVAEIGSVIIRLKDLGKAFKAYKERRVITRTDGVESVEIAVYKEADTNTVAVATAVKERLASIRGDLPASFSDITVEIISDQSRFISSSIEEVLKTAFWGGILAVLVLYFFLRNLRSTLVISLAIPISVLVAFFLMYMSKISLNLMSLGGLALGIGMLVDNSIVVLESINRHRSVGKPIKEAAMVGAAEVGKAVTAATLTTICVFVPIVFVHGVAGQLFVDQALTVAYSLLASLAVALTLIPMLSSIDLSVRPEEGEEPSQKQEAPSIFVRVFLFPLRIARITAVKSAAAVQWLLRPLYYSFNRVFGAATDLYPRVLRWALCHKALVILPAAGIFLGSLLMMRALGTELIPQVSQGEFSVDVKLPAGTPLSTTDGILQSMEAISAEKGDVRLIYSLAGVSGEFSSAIAEEKENTGQLNVALSPGVISSRETMVMEELREEFGGIPGVEYKLSLPALFTFKSPIEVEVRGYNLLGLESLAQEISGKMERIPGVRDIRSNLEPGNPEAQIVFNRQRMSAMGLDVETVGEAIREKIQGEVATEYASGDRKIDVRVRLREEDRANLADLYNLTIGTQNDIPIRLSSLAEIRIERGIGEISRLDQERVALISANLSGRDLGSVVRDIQTLIDDLPLSEEYSIRIGGQRYEMARSFASMRLAILLAVFLVYMVMAAQFESLIHPLVIMLTIPFGITGVILILFLTGTAISVVVLIGTVLLAGIVVNNAIVLVDYINRLRREGKAKMEAIIQAGKIRLRPILMTTSTTVFGLLPLALGLGEGAEIRSPLAVTIIGGLIVSTFLTLVLVPTVYAVFDRKD